MPTRSPAIANSVRELAPRQPVNRPVTGQAVRRCEGLSKSFGDRRVLSEMDLVDPRRVSCWRSSGAQAAASPRCCA